MPKRRVPQDLPNQPSDPADPAIRAFTEKVLSLFAVRCAVFKIDPGSEDFWRLMCLSFVLEYLLPEPPAKAKQTKPERWTPSEKEKLLESVGKKVAGGSTVGDAIKALAQRFPGKQESVVTRYHEAKNWKRGVNRDKIVKAMLTQSPPHPPSPTRPRRTKKSMVGSTNS